MSPKVSLLEIAKKAVLKQKVRNHDPELVELSLAWLSSEISMAQFGAGLMEYKRRRGEKPSTSDKAAYSVISRGLRQAVSEGKIEIVSKN